VDHFQGLFLSAALLKSKGNARSGESFKLGGADSSEAGYGGRNSQVNNARRVS